MQEEQRRAQRQHMLEEQEHIAGQGGYVAPDDHQHGAAPLCMDDLLTNSPRRQLERLLAAATAGSRPVSS